MPKLLASYGASKISYDSLKRFGAEDMNAPDALERYRDQYTLPWGAFDQISYDRDRWKKQKLKFVRHRKSPAHALPVPHDFIFSDEVKNCIDRLEPGVHDPVKIEVLQNDGSRFGGDFWFFDGDVVPKIRAVDAERSNVPIRTKPRYKGDGIFESPILTTGAADSKAYLRSDWTKGHHFFREKCSNYEWFFFSDELFEELDERGLTGSFKFKTIYLS